MNNIENVILYNNVNKEKEINYTFSKIIDR